MNLVHAFSAHFTTVFPIGRDLNIKQFCGMPHETQLTSLGKVCSSFRLESMFLSTGAGPGLSSMSPAKSKSKRLMYIRLLSNRRCGLHGVGRGLKIISLAGTRQLHHGEYSTPSSWRVNAAKITTARRVNLHFILDKPIEYFSDEKAVNRWR